MTCQRSRDCASPAHQLNPRLSQRPLLFLTADGPRVRNARGHSNPQSRCRTRKLPSLYTHHQIVQLTHPKTLNLSVIQRTHPATGNLHTDRKNSHTTWPRIPLHVVESLNITQLAQPPHSTAGSGSTNTMGRGRTFTLKRMLFRGMAEEVG